MLIMTRFILIPCVKFLYHRYEGIQTVGVFCFVLVLFFFFTSYFNGNNKWSKFCVLIRHGEEQIHETLLVITETTVHQDRGGGRTEWSLDQPESLSILRSSVFYLQEFYFWRAGLIILERRSDYSVCNGRLCHPLCNMDMAHPPAAGSNCPTIEVIHYYCYCYHYHYS